MCVKPVSHWMGEQPVVGMLYVSYITRWTKVSAILYNEIAVAINLQKITRQYGVASTYSQYKCIVIGTIMYTVQAVLYYNLLLLRTLLLLFYGLLCVMFCLQRVPVLSVHRGGCFCLAVCQHVSYVNYEIDFVHLGIGQFTLKLNVRM